MPESHGLNECHDNVREDLQVAWQLSSAVLFPWSGNSWICQYMPDEPRMNPAKDAFFSQSSSTFAFARSGKTERIARVRQKPVWKRDGGLLQPVFSNSSHQVTILNRSTRYFVSLFYSKDCGCTLLRFLCDFGGLYPASRARQVTNLVAFLDVCLNYFEFARHMFWFSKLFVPS